MDIGESLFGWVWRRLKGAPSPSDAALGETVPVKRLEALGTLVAGRAWRCAVVRDDGKPPPVGWTFLALPEDQGGGRTGAQEEAQLIRVLFGAYAFRLGLALPASATQAQAEATTAQALPKVIAALTADLPGATAIWQGIRRGDTDLQSDKARDRWLVKTLGCLPRVVSIADLAVSPGDQATDKAPPTQLKLKTRPPSAVDADDDGTGDMPLQHVFEKALTADEYVGGDRTMDGEKDGSWSSEVLAELEVDRVIRTRETAQGYAQGSYLDVSSTAGAEPPLNNAAAFRYAEWFEGAGSYRNDWCTVVEGIPGPDGAGTDVPWKLPALLTLGHRDALIRALRNRPEWRRRLLVGEELDLQAAIDWRADVVARVAGAAGGDRLYATRRVIDLDAAVLILVDRSLSTDTWSASSERRSAPVARRFSHSIRILDAFKEAALAYGGILSGAGARFEVAAFSSLTRRHCDYEIIKGFDAEWTHAERYLRGLDAKDYTRLGPILRHAAARILDERARRRILIVLSDAKPTDYDAYEGRHGIGDVRRAAQELQAEGISLGVVTLSRSDAHVHARAFPVGTVRYVDSAADAVEAMQQIVLGSLRRRSCS